MAVTSFKLDYSKITSIINKTKFNIVNDSDKILNMNKMQFKIEIKIK